jgi:hypothetical protein
VEAGLSETDGLKDVTKLIIAYRNFAEDPKSRCKIKYKKCQNYNSYSIVAEASFVKGKLRCGDW